MGIQSYKPYDIDANKGIHATKFWYKYIDVQDKVEIDLDEIFDNKQNHNLY